MKKFVIISLAKVQKWFVSNALETTHLCDIICSYMSRIEELELPSNFYRQAELALLEIS